MTAFDLSVGDNVNVTISRFGFSQKVFQVVEWNLTIKSDENGGPIQAVNLFLRENNSNVYDWSAEEADFLQDNTTLPNPFDITAPTLTLSDTVQLFNQKAVSVLIADVASTSAYANQFEVETKKSTDSTYISLGVSSSTRFEFVDVEDGATYDVRARIISSLGVKSAFTSAQRLIVGKSAAPADITNFSVNIISNQAYLAWDAVADVDLSHYIIRHSPQTTGAAYANANTIVKKVGRPANSVMVPAQTGTYFVKAVDKFGNVSVNADSSVALVDSLFGYQLRDTQSEHTAFTGSKTNVVVINNKLQLDTSINFDSATGNFDDATGLFDGGGGFVAATGTYDFSDYIDLGAVYNGQADVIVKVEQLPQHTGTPAADGIDVDMFVSTTEDDPAGSPTYTDYRPFIVGSYTARAFRFRAVLTTDNADETPAITELTAEIKLPTRTESDSDIQSGAGAKSVTFPSAFKEVRSVAISVGDMQSGDYYAITNKLKTGFTITFYNSSDAAVDRLFDYVATGF